MENIQGKKSHRDDLTRDRMKILSVKQAEKK